MCKPLDIFTPMCYNNAIIFFEVITMAYLKGKNDEIKGNLDPKYLVQKADPLVLMRTVPFSLGELKMLDTYISRINAKDDTHRTVIFTKEEYEELMGLNSVDYRTLEKNAKGLLGKIVTLEMPRRSFFKFVLFSKAYYHLDKNGKPIIEITCTEEARDLFFCIGKYHYFSYALENVIKLTRKSSYLLYLHIRHNRYRGEWEVPVEELRDVILDCKGQKSYQAFKEFKRAVFDPAVKEINQKTDCHFTYEPLKCGRKIVKIKFIYQAKSQEELMSFDEIINKQLLCDESTDVYEEEKQTQNEYGYNDEPQYNGEYADDDEDEDEYEDEDEKWAEVYGSVRLATLASGCGYEFGKPQMEQIVAVLKRINIPRDTLTDSLTWGRYAYLREKYATLNAEEAKKAQKGQKPIKNRFRYFLKMLEADAFRPAAY